LDLAVHEYGRPYAPVVLALHGFLDHGRGFEPLAAHLNANVRLLCMDLRGHGESSWIGAGGTYTFVDMAADVLEVLRDLDISELSIVGHSMGGVVAAMAAAAIPDRVRALALLEAIPVDAGVPPYARLYEHVRALRGKAVVGGPDARRGARVPLVDHESAVRCVTAMNPRIDLALADQIARTATERDTQGRLVWRFDPLAKALSVTMPSITELEPSWRRLTMPTLLVYGAESSFYDGARGTLQTAHACFSNHRVVTVPDTGHNIHFDRPEAVAAMIADWLVNDASNVPSAHGRSLRWTVRGSVVALEGVVDESFDFASLALAIPPGATLDLAGVERVDASGVEAWLRFGEALSAGSKRGLVLERCSPAIVEQLSLVAGFRLGAEFRSLVATWVCIDCGAKVTRVVEAGRDLEHAAEIREACAECHGALECADLLDSLFALRQHRVLEGAA
jgi:pimeloyl-ACP methyl ester carboxylesterase